MHSLTPSPTHHPAVPQQAAISARVRSGPASLSGHPPRPPTGGGVRPRAGVWAGDEARAGRWSCVSLTRVYHVVRARVCDCVVVCRLPGGSLCAGRTRAPRRPVQTVGLLGVRRNASTLLRNAIAQPVEQSSIAHPTLACVCVCACVRVCVRAWVTACAMCVGDWLRHSQRTYVYWQDWGCCLPVYSYACCRQKLSV